MSTRRPRHVVSSAGCLYGGRWSRRAAVSVFEHGESILPEDLDAVIFSDTGAEWKHTWAVLPRVRQICKRHGIRFIVLRKPRKTGPLGWLRNMRAKGDRSLPAWCRGSWSTIEQKAEAGAYHLRLPILNEYMRFAKIAVTVSASCTDNHKVGAIRRCMNDLSVDRFGLNNRQWAHRVRTGKLPRHRVLIGIAADEASRAINTGRPHYERAVYPLLEMGIDKAAEAEVLERHGLGHVKKSGCFMCPYQPVGWYWALRETNPRAWQDVIDYEATALAANPKMHIIGAAKGRPIEETVARWRERNPGATIEAVLTKEYGRGTKACPIAASQLALFEQVKEAVRAAA